MVYLQTYIYLFWRLLYYAETLFLPAPCRAQRSRSLQLLPWRSPDALVLPAQEPPPNPTPFPGRLVLLPMHRPTLPANRRVLMRFWHTSFKKACRTIRSPFIFLVRNPENYGITEPEMKFPEYSLEQLQKDSEENAAVLEELSSFDTSLLTSDQLFTYRMMKDTLETEAGSRGLELYNQPLSALIGTQAELPTLLAEYTFYNRADIDHYLALLSQIDTYYKQLAAYEQAQADAGLAPSDDTIDRILKSCKSYLIRPENSLLTETFASRLNAVEGLSDAEKASYKAKHLTILKEHFIPAYTNLSKALESLKGSHPEAGGLSTYEHGREYYAYLAAALTGTDSSVDTLKTRIEKQMQADLPKSASA